MPRFIVETKNVNTKEDYELVTEFYSFKTFMDYMFKMCNGNDMAYFLHTKNLFDSPTNTLVLGGKEKGSLIRLSIRKSKNKD